MLNIREVNVLNHVREHESARRHQCIVDEAQFVTEERYRPPITNDVVHGDPHYMLLQVDV